MHSPPSHRLHHRRSGYSPFTQADEALTKRQVYDDIVVTEVASNVTIGVGEVRLRFSPVIGVDGTRAAQYIARDIGCRAGPEPVH